ncbi:MAG: 4-hydroxy-tetrahydrodipicolinate synthase [Candidatus Binatia bacterium]|nr:4-hydroxy-tetrahydrodipicolinate synthase [Candidatus Binatia bacterium]MDG2009074.1 4-hydroxy-tetrahydrodipicolinate synthase [Candidatus Binatia bacterium]
MSQTKCPFTGSMVAVVTPFRDGKVDFTALDVLVERQIVAGQKAIVPCGSTGESATLTHDEHAQVIEAVVAKADGRVSVIAGTGSNATAEAIDLTRAAESAGADGALLISPYYNKPTQDGIYEHYRAVAEAVQIPLITYNIPGRTGSTIETSTLLRLSDIDNIVAVKEATGSLDRVMDVVAACGDKLAVLSGDDPLTLPMISLGAVGLISTTANVAPREIAELTELALDGRTAEASALHYRLLPLMRALFLETNPIPVKAAVAMLGLCEDELRLPLLTMSAEPRAILLSAMERAGVASAGATP